MKPKQRAKVYRKAAEWLFNNTQLEYRMGMCHAISEIQFGDIREYGKYTMKDISPELYLFRPKEIMLINNYWFPDGDYSNERITILLLCEQIALTEQE